MAWRWIEKNLRFSQPLMPSAVEVTNIPISAFSVIINEYEDENYGVGGVTLDKVRKS